jgi:hypothetical protein
MDLRKALYGNIVLSGGSTLTKGFGNRLLHEVQRLAVKDMRIKILAPPERIYTTWTGGSILAGLSTFKKVGFLFPRVCTTHADPSRRCGWRRTNGKKTQTSSTPSSPRLSPSGHVVAFAGCDLTSPQPRTRLHSCSRSSHRDACAASLVMDSDSKPPGSTNSIAGPCTRRDNGAR